MLLIVSPDKREVFRQDLDDYFRLRKRIFIDQLGWDLKSIDDKEMDQFDHDQAHYLIYKDVKTAKVAGGVRLTPSTASNLSLDIFSCLIDSKKVFTPSTSIWESSRFVTESLKTTTSKGIIGEAMFMLLIGMIEYGLHHNLQSFITLTEVRIERLGRMAQWHLQRLGKVEKIGNTYAVLGVLEVSRNVIGKVRESAGILGNVFLEIPDEAN